LPALQTFDLARLAEAPSPNEMLISALRANATRPVVHTADGMEITGSAFEAELSRYAAVLRAEGVREGARVGLLSGNRVEVLYVCHALMLIGAIFVPLHPMGSVADYAYVLEDAGIDVLVFDAANHAAAIDALIDQSDRRPRLLALGVHPTAPDLVAVSRALAPIPLVAERFDPEAICRLIYSGGTTGAPKAIQLSNRSWAAVIMIQMAEWDWPQEVRQLLCAPLSHSGSAAFMPTLLRGGTLFIATGFHPAETMEAIERHRITCILLVPTMIYALLDHPDSATRDLSSLETVFYGASLMSISRLRQAIARFGPIFCQFYGQAEAPLTVTVLRRAEHDLTDDAILGSCGRPVPWMHVALLDDEGSEVADGEPGEICVRGPLVMSGYLGKPEQTAEAFRHGWLHTGDIAVRGPSGHLRIVDRSKDMVITGGFNVYPREVEDALQTHPSVADASVFGVPDPRWGEMVTAAITLRSGFSADTEALVAHVRTLKGPVQAPKCILFLESLPLTALGKPDKKSLRARFGDADERKRFTRL